MHQFRRRLIATACVLGAFTSFASTANAQSTAWPNKVVRLVVPSPAGTAPDIIARVVGDKLSRIWNQPVVVENRPGAGGIVAFSNMKQNEKDEHVLAFVPASSVAMSPYMYKSTQVDIPRDLTPVAFIGESPMVLAVKAESPIKSFAELLAAMKKQPDTLVTAVPLQFSLPHLTNELLSKANVASLRSVPYPGSTQGASAVVGGDAQVVIDGLAPLDGLIQGGRLRGLATFSAKKLAGHPQWAVVADTFPGLVVNGWFGVMAMASMNPATIQKINADVAKVVVMPDVVEKMASLAIFPRSMTVAEFSDFVSSERSRWEKALRDVGAQPQ